MADVNFQIKPKGTPVRVAKRPGRRFVRSGMKPRATPKSSSCCGRGLGGGKKLVPKK